MRIVISGVGGVGGYLAGALARTYPGQVSLVARGNRLASIEERGLEVRSSELGAFTVRPTVTCDPSTLGIADLVFVCVKNYSLEDALAALDPCVDDHTIVVPVLNGVDHGERTRKALGRGHVVDSCIYVIAWSDAEFVIHQERVSPWLNIDGSDAATAETVRQALEVAGVGCHVMSDINRALWEKFLVNCSSNVLTAYHLCGMHEILSTPSSVAEERSLVEECAAVGIAAGVHLDTDAAEKVLRSQQSYIVGDDSTSSMARDALAARSMEIETFCGYVVRRGHELGVDVPVTERFYRELLRREQVLDLARSQVASSVPMDVRVALDERGFLPDRFAKYAEPGDRVGGMPLRSFPFELSGVPEGTASLALTLVDHDSIPVCGFSWIHWCAAGIPAGVRSMPEDASRMGSFGMVQGRTSAASELGGSHDPVATCRYNGPQPPDGTHVYTLKVYALDEEPELAEGFWMSELMRAMRGHVLASAEASFPARA